MIINVRKDPRYIVTGLLVAALYGFAVASQAATILYTNQSDWAAALVPASTSSAQTFDAFAVGDNLRGVDLGPIIPGISLDANTLNLEVFNSGGNNVAFASPRAGLDHATYVINFATAVSAFAFDVAAWNPASPGPANLLVDLGDGTTFTATPQKTTGLESDLYFVGLTSVGHMGITRISWSESPELNFTCCEEVGLDNLKTAVAAVPEPNTYALLLGGLFATGFIVRRRLRS